MPYKDGDKKRQYQAEWTRMRRAGSGSTPGSIALPMPFKLRTAHDVLALLARHIEHVENAEDATVLEKARTVSQMAGVALRAIEITDLGSRIDKVEQLMKRKAGLAAPSLNGAAPSTQVEAMI